MLQGPICKTEGCTQRMKYRVAGLCNVCYQRIRTHGVTTKVAKPSATKHPRAYWGDNITALRKAKGMQVRDFCKALGIDQNTYSRMLRPDGVGLKYYEWVAAYFEVDLSYIFTKFPVSVPDETPGS